MATGQAACCGQEARTPQINTKVQMEFVYFIEIEITAYYFLGGAILPLRPRLLALVHCIRMLIDLVEIEFSTDASMDCLFT